MDNIRKQLERLRPLRVRADRIDVSNTVVLTYGDVLETAVAHFRCCAPALPDFLLVDWGGEASEWTAAAERLQAHIFPVTELARAGRDIPHVFTRPIRERWLPGGFEPMAFLLHKKGISRYQVDSAVYSAIGQWRAPAPEFIEKRMYDVQTVYSALADHESREVFLRIMKCIATGDPGYLPMAAYSQYNHPLVKARRGDVVVEGGVESGYTTLAFAGQVGPQGRVYGFEILKRAADKARLVMKDHSWVSIENLGLWSGESSLFLAGSGAQTRISATPVTDGELCRTIDLDAFLGRHGESCDLLKLDIEGAETECLRGAAGTLDRHRPKLQVSLYHSLSDYLDIPLMLLQRDWGYRLYIGHHRPLYNETCLYAQPPDSFLRRKIPWKEVVTDRFTSLEVLRPVMDRINPACTAVVTFGNVLEDAVRHYAGFEPPLLRQPDFVLADWRKGEHPEWEEIARRLGVRVVRAAEALSLGTTHYCLYTRPNRHLGPVDGYWPLSKVAQKIGLEHAAVDAATVSLFYQPKHDPGYADKYMDAICEIYAALADDDSREIFLRVVKTIVTRDPGYLRMSPYEQYQHPLVHPELGDTMYEGGMSTGENTRIFSGQVGPKGKVYGFEPRQAAAQWVRTHLADCLNVHVEAQGLWSGTYTFHIEDNAGASRVIPVPTKRSTPCRCIDLDSYIANTAGGGGCVIIKLDIEGAEIECLKGAAHTLGQFLPKLQISLHHRLTDYIDIPLTLLRANLGYKLYMGHHSPLSFETCLYALPTKGFVRPATFTDASVRSEQIRKINLELNREGLAVCRMNDTCRADLGKVIETGYPLDIRSLVLIQLAKTVNQDQVPGAVAEFGVFQGWFARRIRKLFPDRSFYLFDTFEGFPPEQMAADMEKYSAKPADFSKTSIEETLKRIGGNPDLVIVKKGIFPASAKDIHEQFAFVSLDVDLYQPTCDGLEFFYARLAPGGFILIHDYGISRWRGVKEGVHKFCQKKKIAMITMPDTCESCVIAKPRCFEKPFPNFPQTCFIRIYSLFVKQYASPDYYEKLRVDPSDYFAASKHPANKLLKKVLTVFGPAPVHTDFSMACLRKKMQGK